MVWRSVGDCTTTVSGIILRRYARAAVIRLTTMPGMDSHAVCAALQRHKSPIRDLVRRDLGARAATEEIVHAPFFVRQRFHRARAPRPQRTGRSTTARLSPGDKQNLSPASRLRSAARIRLRPVRVSASRAV